MFDLISWQPCSSITCSALIFWDAIFTVGKFNEPAKQENKFFFVYERHHALWLPGGGISLNANYITGVRGRADVRRSRTRALSVDTEPTEGAYRFNRIHLPSLSYRAISGLCDQYSSVCSNDTKKNNINIYCEPIFQYYFYNIRSNIKHAKQCAIILHLLPFLSSLIIPSVSIIFNVILFDTDVSVYSSDTLFLS